MHILVVEDNPDDAELLEYKLQQVKHKFDLSFADTLSGALKKLDESGFDLILIDLGLPDSNGPDTLSRILERSPHTPVIVLTGHDDDELSMQLLRLGAIDYIVKDQVTTPLLTRSIMYAVERQAAAETSRWLAAIVESSSDAVIGKSNDNIILSWNGGAEAIYGYTAEEAIGQKIDLILLPDQVDEGREMIQRVLHGEKVQPYLAQRRHKTGTVIDVSISASPVRNLHNEIIGAASIARDVTELLHTQREIEKNNQRLAVLEAREEFMATLTHDLKNPLIGASRMLEVLTENYNDFAPEQIKDILWRIKDSDRQLLMMINNLTEVYCLERDANALHFESINLSETLQSCIDEIRPFAETKKLELKADVHEDLPARADSLSIKRVIQNLLGNALKFTEDTGSITIKASRQADRLVIEIIDNGKGVPLEDQQHLFKRFGKARAQRHSASGTGLGLFYCKQILDAHQGKICYIHEDGAGAHFKAELPAAG